MFYSYGSFHDAMRNGVRRLPFADHELPFLSPEHLAACKAIFARPKDWIDIDQLLFALAEFDTHEATRWVEHIVGPLIRFTAALEHYAASA